MQGGATEGGGERERERARAYMRREGRETIWSLLLASVAVSVRGWAFTLLTFVVDSTREA